MACMISRFMSSTSIHLWFTFHHFLQAAPHHMDILYGYELKLDIGVECLVFIPFPRGFVGHGINLQQSKVTMTITFSEAMAIANR